MPEVSSCYTGWHPWATAVLEAHSWSQEALSISKFTISVWHSSLARSTGALPEDCWHPNWHPWISSIHNWTILIWSTCALPTLTSVSHSSHWLTGIQEEPPRKCQRQGWTPKLPVSTKCAALIATETCRKITALEFQGNFDDGNLRWEIQGNPMLIEVERIWNFKF